jgi:hypothetical protein
VDESEAEKSVDELVLWMASEDEIPLLAHL